MKTALLIEGDYNVIVRRENEGVSLTVNRGSYEVSQPIVLDNDDIDNLVKFLQNKNQNEG